jgi:cellulose synthase/poly-beta-1,6-N-acetylglucosamine synthase-like glycosyltransferase
MVLKSLKKKSNRTIATTLNSEPSQSEYHGHPKPTRLINNSQMLQLYFMEAIFIGSFLYLTNRIIYSPLNKTDTSPALVIIALFSCLAIIFGRATYLYQIKQIKRAKTFGPCPNNLSVAMATTIVPSREIELLESKLDGMLAVLLLGNKLDCWVLDEEEDSRVKELVARYDSKYHSHNRRFFYFTRSGKKHYNEAALGNQYARYQRAQKAGNINAWLNSIDRDQYDIFTFLDLDHIPLPSYLENLLPFFHDKDIGFVQGPDSFRNRNKNFITRAASYERDAFFGIIHRCFYGLRMPIVVGSHTTFRSSALEALGGYYPVHLTEDYLIMLQLRARKIRGVFTDQIIAVGELPENLSSFINQQCRWATGGLDLLLRYYFHYFKDFTWKERLHFFVLLQYYAWGVFSIVGRLVFYYLVSSGLIHRLPLETITAGVAIMIAWNFCNYSWQKQFFIEINTTRQYIEYALLSNLLSIYLFMSFIKAVFHPNQPFRVTVKGKLNQAKLRRSIDCYIPVFASLSEITLIFFLIHKNSAMDLGLVCILLLAGLSSICALATWAIALIKESWIQNQVIQC